jgi:Trk K+ transport system NAD-binding subunit
VDLELVADDAPVGQCVREVAWPPSSQLLGLRRDGAALTAGETTRFERGDRLTLLVPAEHADRITEQLRGVQVTPPSP